MIPVFLICLKFHILTESRQPNVSRSVVPTVTYILSARQSTYRKSALFLYRYLSQSWLFTAFRHPNSEGAFPSYRVSHKTALRNWLTFIDPVALTCIKTCELCGEMSVFPCLSNVHKRTIWPKTFLP